MPTTITSSSTSRRSVLSATFAVLAMPALATATCADAAILVTCRELEGIDAAIDRLCAKRRTIADERATEPQMRLLCDQRTSLEERLESLGAPVTLAGAVALAKAAIATGPTNEDGDVLVSSFEEWITWTVVEFVGKAGEVAVA